MADQPKKVGVYDSGTTAEARPPDSASKVEIERTSRSGTPWWAIALIILAIIVAVVIFT